MYEVSTDSAPLGSRVIASAETWLLDDSGKIKVERIVPIWRPAPDETLRERRSSMSVTGNFHK